MTHTVAIHRVFATRESSNIGAHTIGECRLTGEAKLSLDGKALPATSIEYLMTFALQSLQDAYAGSDSAEAARTAWSTKRDKLIEGTIGARGPGASVPLETKIAREIMRDLFNAKASAEDRAAYKAADNAERLAMLDDRIDRNRAAIDKLVAAEIKRRAETKAKLEEVDFDV